MSAIEAFHNRVGGMALAINLYFGFEFESDQFSIQPRSQIHLNSHGAIVESKD